MTRLTITTAPDFTLDDFQGKPVSLADVRDYPANSDLLALLDTANAAATP